MHHTKLALEKESTDDNEERKKLRAKKMCRKWWILSNIRKKKPSQCSESDVNEMIQISNRRPEKVTTIDILKNPWMRKIMAYEINRWKLIVRNRIPVCLEMKYAYF